MLKRSFNFLKIRQIYFALFLLLPFFWFKIPLEDFFRKLEFV